MAIVSSKEANSKNIFKHLCDQMAKLSVNQITVEEAKAQANLAKQANNLLKYELERAKTMEKYSGAIREIED